MLPSLDNFVSFGGDVIKSRPDYITMLVDIYTESIVNDQLGQNDRVNGSKLAECLLLHLRGGIDHVGYYFFSNVVSICLS
jgi:importin-7